jgi:hypothetical protein
MTLRRLAPGGVLKMRRLRPWLLRLGRIFRKRHGHAELSTELGPRYRRKLRGLLDRQRCHFAPIALQGFAATGVRQVEIRNAPRHGAEFDLAGLRENPNTSLLLRTKRGLLAEIDGVERSRRPRIAANRECFRTVLSGGTRLMVRRTAKDGWEREEGKAL